MSGDLGLKMIGKDPAGLGKGISVTEEGVVNVRNKVDNGLLVEGNLKAGEPLEVPPTKAKATMIAMKGFGGSEDNIVKFEQNVDGLGYLPWKDGQGNLVELNVKGNEEGVFGGFQGFPYFNGGRLSIEGEIPPNQSIAEGFGSGSGRYTLKVIHDASRPFNNLGSGLIAYQTENVIIGVELDEAVAVSKMRMRDDTGTSRVKNFRLEGSNDKESWDVLLTDSLPNDSTDDIIFEFVNETQYLYYRVFGITNNGSSSTMSFRDVRLFLGTTDTQVQLDKSYFTIPEIGFNSSADLPFNGSNRITAGTQDIFLSVDLEIERKVDKISMGTTGSTNNVNEFKFEGSNDNEEWHTLLEGATINSGEDNEFDVITLGLYRYYRIHALSTHGSNSAINFSNVKLFDSGSLYQVKIQEVL